MVISISGLESRKIHMKERTLSILNIFFIIVIVAVIGAGVVYYRDDKMKLSELETQLEDAINQKNVVNEELATKQSNNELEEYHSVEELKDVVSTNLYSAKEVGSKVADLQNRYRDDLSDDEMLDVKQQLSTVLSDSSDIRPWYQDGEWAFHTIYEYVTSDIPVIWTCTVNGDLTAYALSTYHSDSQSFGDVDVKFIVGTQDYASDYSDDENTVKKDAYYDNYFEEHSNQAGIDFVYPYRNNESKSESETNDGSSVNIDVYRGE